MKSIRSPLNRTLVCMLTPLLFGPFHAGAAGLNEHCVVSVLNRNVQAKADGTWVLPNLPANFGKVRARATCVQDGITSYGQSDEFTIPPNGSVTLPPIALGPTTPIPTHLRVSVATPVLTSAGATTQARALATYASGSQVDVTGAGTSYSVSNPAIATITPAGLITAVRSGTVVIQSINEGTQGITQLRVALAGVDSDGDGMPDEVELQLGMNPNNPADAALDVDHDGVSALEEYRAGADPRNPDTDGDGVSDGDEVHCTRGFCSNPLLADTDGDGVRDGTEVLTGSNPGSAASVNWGAALRSVRVTPNNFNLVVNTLTSSASVQLKVVGTMIDGTEIDLTSSARQTRYTSSNVDSCNFGGADGRVNASVSGTCTITVSNNGHSTTAYGTVQDFAPGVVSFVPIPGYANAVAVSGDVAYVAAGSAGLQVVALGNDRRKPGIVAALNLNAGANDIALAGNLAYLATSTGLVVADISTPATPRLLSRLAAVGNAMAVKVRGTTAYVVAADSLHIVNAANPGAMTLAGGIKLGGTGWSLDLDPTRNLAAVAMGEAGLKLVDVSQLSAPVLLGTVQTGDARGVALRGNAAIVADYANSMTSVDVGNLVAPTILSRTPSGTGGQLNNVVLTGNFALGADVAFLNGVPIVDISNPQTLLPRTTLNFTDRNENGMGIAVDDKYIYLTTDSVGTRRGGASGDGRLYIGQYQSILDLAGVAPTAAITAPANGILLYEGAPLTVSVDANDDITVASVRFMVNGQAAFSTTSGPYLYSLRIPSGVTSMEIGAVARDLGGNEGAATPVTVNIVPDPLTQAFGQVIDARDGTPIAGAQVMAPGGRTGITGADGRFHISGVATVLGDLILNASNRRPDGSGTLGASAAVPPVPGGVTDVGEIRVRDVRFETDYGSLQACDGCVLRRSLPFVFPYYGVSASQIRLSDFGSMWIESAGNAWHGVIHAFGDGMSSGYRTLINDRITDRYIVTFERTRFGARVSEVVQVQLFRNGGIVIAFKGVAPMFGPGVWLGFAPSSASDQTLVDFSGNPVFTAPADSATAEIFGQINPFDLDNAFIVLTPTTSGTYEVHTILPAPSTHAISLAGAAAATAPQGGPARLRAGAQGQGGALSASALANAEVRIRSSGNRHYLGMTNTDARGRFTMTGVPSGAIGVEVWRNGALLGRGAGQSMPGQLEAEPLRIDLVSPEARQTKK